MNQEREAVALRPGDLEWAQEVLDGLRLTPKMIAATGSLQTRRAHHAQNSRIDRIILALRSGGEGWLPIVLCPTDGADRTLLLPDGREVVGAHHNPGGWRVTEYLERKEPIMITRPVGFYSSSDPERMPKRQPEQVGVRKVQMRILSALSEGVYPTHFRPNDTVYGTPAAPSPSTHGEG